MLRRDLSWAMALLAAGFGCAAAAGDPREMARSEPALEISQRPLDGDSSDLTTTIEVRITNRGGQTAEEVTVSGAAAKGYRLRAASVLPTRDRERLVWQLGTLAPGESREFRLQWEPLPDMTELSLRCHLRATYRSHAESLLDTPAKQIPAKISIVVPDSATVGVPVAVRIGVVNPNGRPAREVVLQASFSPGLSHTLGKDLENSLGTIDAGQMRIVPLDLIPTQAGELRGKIRVQMGSGAIAEKEFALHAHQTKLALAVSAPTRCDCRASALLSFSIQNNGNEPSRRVRLVVQLPRGISFAAASNGGSYVADGHCVYWDFGDVRPGEQRQVKLDTVAQIAGEQKVTAVLSAEGREPHSHSLAIQVQGPLPDGSAEGRRP